MGMILSNEGTEPTANQKACSMATTPCFVVFLATLFIATVATLEPCPGDTRLDKRCNFDRTHRVCAKIGVPGSSFWKFTGQSSWCQKRGAGDSGRDLRCPGDKPTWCICKWATARWIKGQGCDETIQFNCEATDVCDVKHSYKDYNVRMKPAHDCMAKKCKKQWDKCVCENKHSGCERYAKAGNCEKAAWKSWMSKNCRKSCDLCGSKRRKPTSLLARILARIHSISDRRRGGRNGRK